MKRTVKILFLIRHLNYAGAEYQLVTLAKALRQQGHAVAVAVFYTGGPLETDLTEAGVPVHSLGKSGRWETLGFIWRLVKLVRSEKPDVLHGYLSVSNILTVLMRLICPGVRVAWGVRASNMDLSDYDWLMRFSHRIECWLSRFADLIIVNSYAGLRYSAANGFPGDRMIVIPNGIDTDRFRPDAEGRRRVRGELGIKEGQTLIGLVGRIDPMKDHATFLKAASMLAEKYQHLVFVCVGRSCEPYKQQLVRMSNQLALSNRLIWAEARTDMPAVYNALDVLVSSSAYGEGFPNVIGEALACGVSCVVTDVGDSALLVSESGEVVPPRNPQAIKAAIEKHINGARASTNKHESNRQRIRDQFSVATLESRTESALIALCERPGTI